MVNFRHWLLMYAKIYGKYVLLCPYWSYYLPRFYSYGNQPFWGVSSRNVWIIMPFVQFSKETQGKSLYQLVEWVNSLEYYPFTNDQRIDLSVSPFGGFVRRTRTDGLELENFLLKIWDHNFWKSPHPSKKKEH